MKLRAWMAIALAAATLLQACGGGGNDSGSGSMRLVNATDDYASLDMYTSDGTTETQRTTGVTTDTAGAYVALGAGAYTVNLKRTGSSTTSSTSSRTVVKDNSHTLVAYSSSGTLKSVFLTDTEAAPSAGTAKLRVFNGSDEAGTVEVYVIGAGNSLDNTSPITPNLGLPIERISPYTEVGAGTYRIVVTGVGNKTDVRLDLPSVTLVDQQILTLVLTKTSGGVLVHARMINQKDTVTPERNTSARVWLVVGPAGGGTVVASVNGTALPTLTAGNRPVLDSGYRLVPAGPLVLNATLNGAAVAPNTTTTPLPTTLVAGSDNTLLISGSSSSGVATLINDNNSPSLNANSARLRLVHGIGNLSSPITLTANFAVVAGNVVTNSASAAADVAASTSTTPTSLDATTPALANSIYTQSVPLLIAHTYTLFMLGDIAAPIGVVRADR